MAANCYVVFSTIVQTETATTIDVSSAPGETVITTLGITYTTQLPAQTSYATETVGTQTVVVRYYPWLKFSSIIANLDFCRARSQWQHKR